MDSIDTLLRSGFDARRAGRSEEALACFERALEDSRAGGWTCKQALSLRAVAQIARDRGDLDAALSPLEEAVAIFRTLGEPLLLAHTVRHLADLHLDAERLEEAEPLYVEALGIYRGRPEARPLDLANAIRPYAILLARRGRRQDAIDAWTEACSLYAELGIDPGVEECESALSALGAG